MPHPALRSLALSGLLLSAAPAVRAATTVTVHNLTGRALSVSRPWHPWRPEPDDGARVHPAFRRWLRPFESATYRFLLPGRDQEVDLVVRRLATSQALQHDGLIIRAVDLDLAPAFHGPEPGIPDPDWAQVIGEDLPPEPEAKASAPR